MFSQKPTFILQSDFRADFKDFKTFFGLAFFNLLVELNYSHNS